MRTPAQIRRARGLRGDPISWEQFQSQAPLKCPSGTMLATRKGKPYDRINPSRDAADYYCQVNENFSPQPCPLAQTPYRTGANPEDAPGWGCKISPAGIFNIPADILGWNCEGVAGMGCIVGLAGIWGIAAYLILRK